MVRVATRLSRVGYVSPRAHCQFDVDGNSNHHPPTFKVEIMYSKYLFRKTWTKIGLAMSAMSAVLVFTIHRPSLF